jgi:hypothetical protein
VGIENGWNYVTLTAIHRSSKVSSDLYDFRYQIVDLTQASPAADGLTYMYEQKLYSFVISLPRVFQPTQVANLRLRTSNACVSDSRQSRPGLSDSIPPLAPPFYTLAFRFPQSLRLVCHRLSSHLDGTAMSWQY